MIVTINNQIYRIEDIKSIEVLNKKTTSLNSYYTKYWSKDNKYKIVFGFINKKISCALTFEDNCETVHLFDEFKINFFIGEPLNIVPNYPKIDLKNVNEYLNQLNDNLTPDLEILDKLAQKDWEEYIKLINKHNEEIINQHNLLVSYWSTGDINFGTNFNFNYKNN